MKKAEMREIVPLMCMRRDGEKNIVMAEGEIITYAGRKMAITPYYEPYKEELSLTYKCLTDCSTGLVVSPKKYKGAGALKRVMKNHEEDIRKNFELNKDAVKRAEEQLKKML